MVPSGKSPLSSTETCALPQPVDCPPWLVSAEDSRLPEIGLDAREFFDGGRGGGDESSESSSPQLPDLLTSGIGRGGGRSNVLLKQLTLEDMVGGRPEKLLKRSGGGGGYKSTALLWPPAKAASSLSQGFVLQLLQSPLFRFSPGTSFKQGWFWGNPLSTDELWSVCFPGYTSVDIAGTAASNPYMLTGNPGTFTPLKGVALVLQA